MPLVTRESRHTRIDVHSYLLGVIKKQLSFLLAHAQIPIEWLKMSASEYVDAEDEFPEDILDCLSNTQPSRPFKEFGKEVLLQSHLDTTSSGLSANVDSACANLVGTFFNTFVNAGFGIDTLMVEAKEGDNRAYKSKDYGMMSAAASLGLGLLWDTDVGLSHNNRYTYSPEEWIKAGAFFATGPLNVLHQVMGYYYMEPDYLLMVHITQDLVLTGKGMIRINPFFLDRNIMS
ncbi:hypothetical protein F4604DRAFT_1934583 [Suillus subluteus]|nr:hypothetical protein F4604DRAFT_1934583 [Suillus subluteus]